ncbi:MAG: uroporphyrinogen-III synthase [Bacteroidales bacterium]
MTLEGKVFISTVSAGKSAEIRNIFQPLGATVVDCPMTAVVGSDLTPQVKEVMINLGKFHWIIFTSANGVIFFHRFLQQSGNSTMLPPKIKVAVVGPKTALALEKTGRTADFTGSGDSAESLLDELIENFSMEGSEILLPLGNLAPETLEIGLSEIAVTTRMNVYHTIKTNIRDTTPFNLVKSNRYDLVLFTSPSGVLNFSDTLGTEIENQGVRAAAIGKVTSRAVDKQGYSCLVTASTSTYQGLADEIVNYYKSKNRSYVLS